MKLVVLTGCSRGLGYSLYRRILDEDSVQLICVSKNIADDQSAMLSECPNKLNFIQVDFGSSDKKEFGSFLENRIQELLSNDLYTQIIFINNSSVVEPIGMIGNLDSDDVRLAININFQAPIVISQILARISKQQSANLKVLNISSGAAKHPISGWPLYCSTKSAMVMFFDVMSKMDGCEIVHIDPGVLDTDMQATIRDQNKDNFPDVEAFVGLDKNGRLEKPSTVANRIVNEYILP